MKLKFSSLNTKINQTGVRQPEYSYINAVQMSHHVLSQGVEHVVVVDPQANAR